MKIKVAGFLSIAGLIMSVSGTFLTLAIVKPEWFFPLSEATQTLKPQKFSSGQQLQEDLNEDQKYTNLHFDDVMECIKIYELVANEKNYIQEIYSSDDKQSYIYTINNRAQKNYSSDILEGWYDVAKRPAMNTFLDKYHLNTLDLLDISYVIEISKVFDNLSGNLLEIRSYKDTYVYSEPLFKITHLHEVNN